LTNLPQLTSASLIESFIVIAQKNNEIKDSSLNTLNVTTAFALAAEDQLNSYSMSDDEAKPKQDKVFFLKLQGQTTHFVTFVRS